MAPISQLSAARHPAECRLCRDESQSVTPQDRPNCRVTNSDRTVYFFETTVCTCIQRTFIEKTDVPID